VPSHMRLCCLLVLCARTRTRPPSSRVVPSLSTAIGSHVWSESSRLTYSLHQLHTDSTSLTKHTAHPKLYSSNMTQTRPCYTYSYSYACKQCAPDSLTVPSTTALTAL
jgi:hypothetical protein